MHWRYTKESAPWISALFLLGVFIDIQGGFQIKQLLGLVALVWVVRRRESWLIWIKCKADLLVFIAIPLVLGMPHVIIDAVSSDSTGVADLYGTMSSWVLIILLPLFYRAGGLRVIGQLRTGFRAVALVIIVLGCLHVLGIINLADYAGFAMERKLGYIGLDPRQAGIAESHLRPMVALHIAHTLPLAFGLELASSWWWAGAIAIALIMVMMRGLLLGLVIALVFWLALNWRKISIISLFSIRRVAAGGLILLVTGVFMSTVFSNQTLLIKQLLEQNVEGIMIRLAFLEGKDDWTIRVRTAHIEGYFLLLEESPLAFLVGVGPSGDMPHPFWGRARGTEASIINIAMYYGLPYALLYVGWLYLAAWKLWQLRRQSGYTQWDTGLIVGAMVFYITGNFNPQMTSVMAMMAFMLLRVRILELTGYRPR